jgi:hypothetical protein
MISFINTDLTEGKEKIPNRQPTNEKPQTNVYCRVNKKAFVQILKMFSEIIVKPFFSRLKDPKHVIPPKKQKPSKLKITWTECPKETGTLRKKSAVLNCRTFERNHSFPF